MRTLKNAVTAGILALTALTLAAPAQANDKQKRPARPGLVTNENVVVRGAPSQGESARPNSGTQDSADASRKSKPLTTTDCIKDCGPGGYVLTKEGEKAVDKMEKAVDKTIEKMGPSTKGVVANADGSGDLGKPSF